MPTEDRQTAREPNGSEIRIAVEDRTGGTGEIVGDLSVPQEASAVVVFAHGSGSSRHSPRNRAVAAELRRSGHATLLVDLLTTAEEHADAASRRFRFDIALLAERLVAAVAAVRTEDAVAGLPIGLFGASTGAAAALVAASDLRADVGAVVSRGGRPDLAGDRLPMVGAPTLLIVGGDDAQVLELNREAAAAMHADVAIEVVPGAGHLFEEPGALDAAATMAQHWFATHLRSSTPRASRPPEDPRVIGGGS